MLDESESSEKPWQKHSIHPQFHVSGLRAVWKNLFSHELQMCNCKTAFYLYASRARQSWLHEDKKNKKSLSQIKI